MTAPLPENYEQLQALAAQHPYYAHVQLLLTRKMLQENNPAFEEQYHKCLLYFPAQLWLDHLLQEKETPDLRDTEVAGNDVADEKLTQLIASQAQHFNTALKGDEKLFEEPEPLYKTDYFKHEGIEDEEPANMPEQPLGQKVKRFTDWLKDMKKLHPATPQFSTTAAEEKYVAEKAQHSLEDKGVLTESMAEVQALQGKRDKAIAIYKKLSLSNPEKSSYFAAKIESLQENNS